MTKTAKVAQKMHRAMAALSRTGDPVVSVKLSDKRGALVDLGRHLGFFEVDNKQQQTNIIIVEDGAV